jgi:hypothetical protein
LRNIRTGERRVWRKMENLHYQIDVGHFGYTWMTPMQHGTFHRFWKS